MPVMEIDFNKQLERPRFAILLDRKRLGPLATVGKFDPRRPGALRLVLRPNEMHSRHAAPVRCSFDLAEVPLGQRADRRQLLVTPGYRSGEGVLRTTAANVVERLVVRLSLTREHH